MKPGPKFSFLSLHLTWADTFDTNHVFLFRSISGSQFRSWFLIWFSILRLHRYDNYSMSQLSVSLGIRFLSLLSSLPSFSLLLSFSPFFSSSFLLFSLHVSWFFHPQKERLFKNTKWEFSVWKGRRKILKEERFEKMISITVWIMESKRLTFLAFQLFLTDHPLPLCDCYVRRGSQRERERERKRKRERERKKFLERERIATCRGHETLWQILLERICHFCLANPDNEWEEEEDKSLWMIKNGG